MAVDRYTKLVLTVIAVCLVWLSLGGPSLMTPVSAQVGDRVILAGWLDRNGVVIKFPTVPKADVYRDRFGNQINQPEPFTSYPLPITELFK
jgi:hypothetical protein